MVAQHDTKPEQPQMRSEYFETSHGAISELGKHSCQNLKIIPALFFSQYEAIGSNVRLRQAFLTGGGTRADGPGKARNLACRPPKLTSHFRASILFTSAFAVFSTTTPFY